MTISSVSRCDRLQQLRRHEAIHQVVKRLAAIQACAKEGCQQTALKQVVETGARKCLNQSIIPCRPKEGVRRIQRANTHSGNDVEFWPRTLPAPACQDASPETAARSATGEREHIERSLADCLVQSCRDSFRPHPIGRLTVGDIAHGFSESR
jgi:hypothetical protein